MSGAGPAVLVVSLAGFLITGLTAIIVALLRSSRGSPEQRDASTAAFTAATTTQSNLLTIFEKRNTALQLWAEWARSRMTQLAVWGQTGGGEEPPPPAGPEPPI